jgi:Kef-type K+ transport system membrane component KefB
MNDVDPTLAKALAEPPYEAMALLASVMVVGWLLKRWTGQPLLIGMMLMGFVLGPTGFGYVCPETFMHVFGPLAMVFLGPLARLGLTFYQGITGLDFDPNKLLAKDGDTVNWKRTMREMTCPFTMAVAGIAATFACGIPASHYLYTHFCDTEAINFLSFALYTSAALSITSIVTVGYILKKSGLSKTAFGARVMAAVLFCDVVGWLVVCCVDAYAKSGDIAQALPQMGIILGFIAVMIAFVRPALARLMPKDPDAGTVLGTVVILTLVTAFICHHIGIHPLFGSFVLGAVMPKHTVAASAVPSQGHHGSSANYSDVIAVKMEYFQEVFFLPLFLGFSGLRTNLWTLLSTEAIIACALVTFVAVGAKFFAVTTAHYLSSEKRDLRESLGSGSLMIGLGLMGLMIVNMAMDAGQYNQTVFTIMVMPGLISTILVYPLLERFYLRRAHETTVTEHDAVPQQMGMPEAVGA